MRQPRQQQGLSIEGAAKAQPAGKTMQNMRRHLNWICPTGDPCHRHLHQPQPGKGKATKGSDPSVRKGWVIPTGKKKTKNKKNNTDQSKCWLKMREIGDEGRR